MSTISSSPFGASTSLPGKGEIVISLLPPKKPVLTTFNYQYPLKLVAPKSHSAPSDDHPVSTVFLLTYGGGIVGGDKISLSVSLATATRLILVTQGSTKIFKSTTRDIVSGQTLDVRIAPHAALCYLPDPTQPFGESVYEQKQTFYVEPDGTSNLCVLDWVTEGRKARGESWNLWRWQGRNEVRQHPATAHPEGPGKLLLRDSVILSDDAHGSINGLKDKTDNMGVFGTLIIAGNMFKGIGDYFMAEFSKIPRIGAKRWTAVEENEKQTPEQVKRDRRQQQERGDGLLWTAANVRGLVLVKFGARDLEGARRWLYDMITAEGSVEKFFGDQALFCLR